MNGGIYAMIRFYRWVIENHRQKLTDYQKQYTKKIDPKFDFMNTTKKLKLAGWILKQDKELSKLWSIEYRKILVKEGKI